MLNVQCTVCSVASYQCAVWQCEVCSVAVYSAQNEVYSVQSTVCNVQPDHSPGVDPTIVPS